MFEHVLLKYSSLDQLGRKIIIFNTFLWRKGPTEAKVPKAQQSEVRALVKGGEGRGGGYTGVHTNASLNQRSRCLLSYAALLPSSGRTSGR